MPLMNPGIVTILRMLGTRCANTRTTREQGILESLPSGGRLKRNVPTLTLHGINGEIFWELPPHKQGIHQRKGIPLGITSS
jgi:hypothetical protein